MPSSNLNPTPSSQTKIITFQVGERRFNSTVHILTKESEFFSTLLSNYQHDTSENEPFFIDVDGGIFVHILRYLCNRILPLFYSASAGFDHALYLAVLEQARYFQIPRLEKWIQDKCYLTAVRTTISVEEGTDLNTMARTMVGDTEIQCHPVWTIKKVYVCPRRILVHMGRPEACGRACENALDGDDYEYEEVGSWKVVVVKKTTTFHPEVCNELGK